MIKRDHSKLICDIGELTALLSDSSGFDSLLQRIVELIAQHMSADVCSVYLYYEDPGELVLKATKGLDPSSIGNVRLKLGEGLTGQSLLELRPVYEGDALGHPGFRYFSGIGEEEFSSFLAVPILRGQSRIGAMTLQSRQKNHFTPEDIHIFRAITSQLANTIEMARALLTVEAPRELPVAETAVVVPRFIKGRVGAEGFAYGEAVIIEHLSWDELVRGFASSTDYTLDDLHQAVIATERDLESLQKEIEGRLFDVASLIFSAQIMMLKDKAMLSQMDEAVSRGLSPVAAVHQVIRSYIDRFDRMSNEFIREKKYDVIDVGRRLLEKLTGVSARRETYAKKVVIARDMLPSDALKMSSQCVAGIVLLSGGPTSHVAVLSRSLNIPLIIVNERALLSLLEGTKVLLDGAAGNVYVDPDKDVVAKFHEKEELRRNVGQIKARLKSQTLTKDGVRIQLMANINLLGDVAVALDYQAEGIGLYRTEFPFLIRSEFPTEEEQFAIYRKLIELMKGCEVTFRTLDIGGDKALSYYDYGKEANPFLGLRSIRFSLRHRDIFAQQLRAILRAAWDSPVRIMFPMVTSVDDLREAKAVLSQCIAELQQEGVLHQVKPVVGVMIELPSAVEMIDALAKEAEFFSVGTNDLIQYTLAVDRTNEKVADLYVAHHPAVLRSLAKIASAAARHKRDVSICGDMAHEPRYMAFLVGIGIRKFSLDARYLPNVQETLQALDTKAAAALSAQALACDSLKDVALLFAE